MSLPSPTLGELLAAKILASYRTRLSLLRLGVEHVHRIHGQGQELVLVHPLDVFLLELLCLLWWWRRLSDLGDQIGS